MTWIQTRKGRKFDLCNPRAKDIDPEEVAYALARINRFTGHANTYHPLGLGYTVAQHCVLCSWAVADLLPENHKGTVYETAVCLEALVHDAGEAYTGDVSAPLKVAMRRQKPWDRFQEPLSDFDYIEADVWKAVAERFKVPVEANPLVKVTDLRLLQTEARSFMAPMHPEWTSPVRPFDFDICEVWDPKTAERAWLDRLARLQGRSWSVQVLALVQMTLNFGGAQ